MQNKVNSFSGFQPLKQVWLGDCYPLHFYDHLDSEVRDAFATITEWTQADLAHIQTTLESMGVDVQRPEFTNSAEDYLHNGQLLKPPICPRDTSMALGNEFYHLRSHYKQDPWAAQLAEFEQANTVVHKQSDGPLACLYPPSVVRVGRDIYVDYDTHEHVWEYVAPVLTDWAKQYRVHVCKTGGHSDGVFCPVAPGVIVANHWLTHYENTFPDWEVYHVRTPFTVNGVNNQWHIPEHTVMNNPSFARHIEQYAKDWVGNVKETVFETNMLVIDQHRVLAIAEDPVLFKWLEARGIQVTLCDFRCRGFWDGGLHCLTTDIRREGPAEDYFPARPAFNYMDWLC